MFRQTIVNNNDLGLAELLSKRLDESVAGPGPMDGLDAKGIFLNGYCCFHDSPRVKEFASKFDGMAIVFETLRAAFDMHDRVQWCDVAVERDQRAVEGLLKVLCSAAHDFTHHVSGGEQAMRVDARSPDPSGSPRFQGRLREPAASFDRRLPVLIAERLGSSQMSRSPSSQSIPCNRSAPEPMMRYRSRILARTSSTGVIRTSSNLGFTCAIAEAISSAVGLNAEERDQFIDHGLRIFSKLGEVDPMDRNFGMFLNERFAMFQKRTL